MTGFTTQYDIANRALQRLGSPFLDTFSDPSKQAAQAGFAYDKLRLAELERSVWRFATFRATIRPITSTTKRMIPPVWVGSGSYDLGAVVQDSNGIYWICQVANSASATNGPGSVQAPAQPNNWTQYFGPIHGDLYSASVTYSAGEVVYAIVDDADVWYISIANNNLNNTLGTAGIWVALTATDLPIPVLGPAGVGVTNQVARNVFMLPNGYLRPAAPDPRIPSGPTTATSGGLKVLDYQFEQNYFVSRNTTPVILRYVADISDVSAFDPLFCEGLGARLAYELCETLTQSQVKQQSCAVAYEKFIGEARNKNLLEVGSTEEDDPDFLMAIGPAGVMDRSPGMNSPQQRTAQG